ARCVYCAFLTAPVAATRKYITAYLDALERELAAAKPLIKNLRSVYVGGGTPFALDADELERVFKAIAPLRTNGCEYTVEAGRPDVFTKEKLDLCKKYGVTRLCINAQSFSDETLEAIGRKHTAAQIFEAFEMTKPYGFTLNCDLIAGLTGESLKSFCHSVDCAIALSPENITVHTLCLKKGAKLKEETSVLAEGELAEMIAYSRKTLTQAGYEPYYLYRQKYMAGAHENVGWTKKGYASVYNIDVMEECADNLAVGANAVTKKLFLSEGRIERIGSPKDIPTYLEKGGKVIAEKNGLFA
ncbi:MAG: coproporphyrinogen dehydrogenase HemZ, partial [Clostridiales bacterium]|nr:coproporphyrinogen dehydrogenase HemZ [Clostridiales bacterium]